MPLSRRHLHALSHDPGILTRAVLIILVSFLLSGLWLGINRPPATPEKSLADLRTEEIRKVLQAQPLDRVALVRALRDDAHGMALFKQEAETGDGEEAGPEGLSFDLPALLAASSLPVAEQPVFASWHAALLSQKVAPDQIAALENLVLTDAPALPRTMAADLKRVARDYEGALAAYEAAGALPDAVEARRRAVDLALSREWPQVAERLLAQPAYYEAVHAVQDHLTRETARHQLDVGAIFRRMVDFNLSLLRKTDYLLLSLLTGVVWFVSLHKACRLPRRQWWLSLLGIPLGMFSTVITLVLLDLQEARNGLTDSEAAGPALLFQIASVGLREESAKLICVLPLLLLLRKGTPGQALMAASCVGLGFAVKENISYYAQSEASGVLGRFVTANFMHLAMTGLTGHALFQFLRYPKNYGPAFFATFVCMVMLHGFYNFSAGGHEAPFFQELSNLFPFIVAGLAYHYFQTVLRSQDQAPQRLSAHAVFLLGSAVIMGTLLNFLVWENGWALAIHAFVPSFLSSVMFAWLFVHFLRRA